MRNVTLTMLFDHPIVQKYVGRSGMDHAISVAEHAVAIADKYNVCPDHAAKAGLLHDIGHYEWYQDGEWDFKQYKENDIHAIKGAERAHKLLIRLGEHPAAAKEMALAILLHTDSYLPEGTLELRPLQKVVSQADTADEEPNGQHHYRKIDKATARIRVLALDHRIDYLLQNASSIQQLG